jgi:hypothetical protein
VRSDSLPSKAPVTDDWVTANLSKFDADWKNSCRSGYSCWLKKSLGRKTLQVTGKKLLWIKALMHLLTTTQHTLLL